MVGRREDRDPGQSRVNPTRPAVARQSRRAASSSTAATAPPCCSPPSTCTTATVAGWVTDSTRAENFVAFLADLVAQTPTGLELHCIVDNLSAHGTPAVDAFLDDHPHVFLHRTPTHASWLNQVELFFSIMERRLLRHGEFDSVDDLADRIIAFINDYNRRAAHSAGPTTAAHSKSRNITMTYAGPTRSGSSRTGPGCRGRRP